MEAKEVLIEQSITSLLERKLNEKLSNTEHIEVLNFGVAGYGFVHYYLLLRSFLS